jgi:hypothetical protein
VSLRSWRATFRRLSAAVIVVAVVAVCAGGCGFPDRRGAAESIGQTIRTMPGVAGADVRYNTSFDGGAHFDLAVTLIPTASNEQGAAVGRAFIEKLAKANFAHFDVTFELIYRRAGTADIPGSYIKNSSSLRTAFSFDDPAVVRPDRSPDAVAEAATWWLDIARSPAVETVSAALPLQDRYTGVSGPNLHVQVPVGADDAVLTDLIAAHPQLNSAAWDVSLPGRDAYTPAKTYSAVGLFLDRRLRQTWQSIVACLLPIDPAEAATQLPPKRGWSPTEATITLVFDNGRQGDFDRVARSVAPLLAQLPGPVLFHLTGRDVVERNLAVTIGGCTTAGTPVTHPNEPLEAELRHLYEKC